MLSNSILAFLATSLLLSTGSATPLVSDKVSTDAITFAATQNPAISFGTYTDRSCSGGQHDYQNPDDGCYTLPGQGMHVWWFADTCRAFIYKGGDCSPASGEIQVTIGQCYDTAQYRTIKVFCH
ncbi:hypothetical protein CC80DRAFT_494856 [Byssothecium circinans]|uniref:Uncharacterized protein n=1 Tax=Byssothecium circinans TaxID=147558 RepID=A0A6A5TLH5_9PLEO|nr:hypothetical protein CC80DRAFT_494856 [Byssothecium circinans]